MAATAVVWQPREDGLSEICALLEQQISPSSAAVDKSQIWKQLQHFSQIPDFNNYLVFILVRAQVLSLLSVYYLPYSSVINDKPSLRFFFFISVACWLCFLADV